MNEKNSVGKAVVGFLLTIAGVVIGLVGALLAWPALIAVALGGASVGQALGNIGGRK